MKIILGSQSKGRKKMLEEMGIEFEIMPADIDEKAIRFDDPKKLVTELAKAKAEAIKSRISDPAILITSDQVVVCNGIIREKPESAEEAREFLASYEHFPAETVTSVVVTDLSDGKQMAGVDIAKVYFDKFDEAEIESIIDDGEVFWLAGAFDIDDEKWKKHIVRMEGTRDSIVGLPKELTKKFLCETHFIDNER